MSRRFGFAIASAIVSIVIIGFLVTAALFAASQESRATGAGILDAKAFAHAEQVAVDAVQNWSCPGCDLLAAGTVIIRDAQASPPLEGTVYITRLDSAVFLVTGEAKSVESGVLPLRRRVSIAVSAARDSLGVMRTHPLPREFWWAVYSP